MGTVPERDTGSRDPGVLMGRTRELAQVAVLFARGARLVTVIGPGGVGKSRLALRSAGALGRCRAPRPRVVDVAALPAGALLPAVAQALGVGDLPDPPTPRALAARLARRRLLLVLDNCEKAAPAVAVAVHELLSAVGGLRVLATSRQSLGCVGEHVLALAPLGEDDAVRLFTVRGRAALPGFAVTAGNRAAVAGVCRRLDCLPLGVELAAATMSVLSPAQLLVRLDAGAGAGVPDLLPSAPARHRSPWAVLDHSYDLCVPEERVLWARVSVFAGEFDIEAAEAVCGGDGLAPERVLDHLAGLLDKSVLTCRLDGAGARYRLATTARRYGRARLAASGAELPVRLRHRDRSLGWALAALGLHHWRQHEPDQAVAHLHRALRLRSPDGGAGSTEFSLRVLAWTMAAADAHRPAARLLGACHAAADAADAAPRRSPFGDYHDDCARTTRAALGEGCYTRAFTWGTHLSVPEAVAYALGSGS